MVYTWQNFLKIAITRMPGRIVAKDFLISSFIERLRFLEVRDSEDRRTLAVGHPWQKAGMDDEEY